MYYYTYAYLREDRTPYYIGKGIDKRIYSKWRNVKPPKDKSKIIYLKQNITEEEAFRHEIYMIALYGRKDLETGILHNRTNGGEGCSGVIRSEEWKNNQSIILKNKGLKWWNNGSKDLMAKDCPGPEWVKGYLLTPNKGLKWWNNGITNTMKKDCPGIEWKPGRIARNIGDANTKKKHWNNGVKNIMATDCPGKEWKLGMIAENSTKGYKWWNNGVKNTRALDCPGKEWKNGYMFLRNKNQ